jgi:hypothetical protein
VGYRFSARNTFGSVAAFAFSAAYIGLQFDWLSMVGWWPFAILAVLLVSSLAYWVWDANADERHARAMLKFAMLNKWEFNFESGEYRRWFHSFPFDRGSMEKDTAFIRGPFNGLTCATYTHELEIGQEDKRTRKERWQITLAEIPYSLPTIDIVPDDSLAKLTKVLGGMDVDFESSTFNKMWRVKAGNLKYAHDIVHPRMMERLLQYDAEGLALRIEGRAVLCWQADPRGPEDLARRLSIVTAVAKLIPSFVLREFEYIYKKQEEEARKREENAPEWAKTPFALTSGRYTGIGAEDQVAKDLTDEATGAKPPTTRRPDNEDRAW